MSQSAPAAAPATPPKATLFCPRCGHQGHVREGWATPSDGDSRYACPVCGEIVGRRTGRTETAPRGEVTPATAAADPLTAWGRATWKTWRAGVRTWWGWWALGRSGAE